MAASASRSHPVSESPAIDVLVGDTCPIVLRGLVALIDDCEDMRLVAAAGNGSELLALYERHRPSVTVLDPLMADGEGQGIISAIQALDPEARVIVLADNDAGEDIGYALRAGARAYLLKDVALENLLATIRTVHSGHSHVPPSIAEKLAEHIRRPPLTRREREVLRALVAGQSNKQIEAELSMSASTVKTHIAHIFQKLNVTDRTQAVSVALRTGLDRRL